VTDKADGWTAAEWRKEAKSQLRQRNALLADLEWVWRVCKEALNKIAALETHGATQRSQYCASCIARAALEQVGRGREG